MNKSDLFVAPACAKQVPIVCETVANLELVGPLVAVIVRVMACLSLITTYTSFLKESALVVTGNCVLLDLTRFVLGAPFGRKGSLE